MAATVPNTTKKRTSTKKPSNVKASITSSSKTIPGMYMYHNPRGICQVVSIEKDDNGDMYINVKLLERDGRIIPLQYPQVIGNQLVFLSEDEIQKRLSELNPSEDVNSSNIKKYVSDVSIGDRVYSRSYQCYGEIVSIEGHYINVKYPNKSKPSPYSLPSAVDRGFISIE